MPDLRISQLPPLTQALLQATDPLAIADLSASETKQITAKDFVQGAVALIDNLSIPGEKVNVVLGANVVGTAQLQDDSVTSAKLANGSVTVIGAGLPGTGAYIGQLAVNTTNGYVYIWDGGAWQAYRSSATINQVTGGTAGDVTTTVTTVGDVAQVVASINNATGPAQVLAGPTAGAGAVGLRGLVSSDLPKATNADAGAVSVPTGSGIRLNGGGSGLEANIEIDNDVTASGAAYHVVNYDAKGLVTAGRLITNLDLPAATTGAIGAIAAGTEFTVAAGGILNHANQVASGSGTKVFYDAQGHITASADLDATDIPELPATKITTGPLDVDVINDRTIPSDKLADYAVSYIQEATPPASTTAAHIGMLWFQESTGALRMYNGNSWFPVGFGRLAQDNLRWGGLFDASTALVTGVTNLGLQAGLAIGGPIPDATDLLGGLYLVCEVAGSNVAQTPGVTYDPGDWLLCVNQTNGWERIDTLSGSGGGGANFLNDLLDVEVNNPLAGQLLVFNSVTGQWNNGFGTPASETQRGTAEIATQLETDTGTDDERIVTPLKLSTYVSQNLWIDGGSAVSNFGSAPALIDGGAAA